jgi:hypothetical protein
MVDVGIFATKYMNLVPLTLAPISLWPNSFVPALFQPHHMTCTLTEVVSINLEHIPTHATAMEIITTSGMPVVLPFGTTASSSTWCCDGGEVPRANLEGHQLFSFTFTFKDTISMCTRPVSIRTRQTLLPSYRSPTCRH